MHACMHHGQETSKVQRSLNGSTYTTVGTLAASTTTFTDTGLDDNTPYYYRVYASNVTGNSAYSNVLNVTTLLAIPAAPTSLAVAGITSGEANQEIWDGICLAPVDGVQQRDHVLQRPWPGH